jgi:hypothetical protein
MNDIRSCSNCRNEDIEICPKHPLNSGIVKIMNLNIIFGSGCSWANIIDQEEKRKLIKMTKQERYEYEQKEINRKKIEEERSLKDMKEYMMKKKSLFTDNTSGMAKKKFNKTCKHQYEHGKLCPKASTDESTNLCPEDFSCGCWPHKELRGKCSFIHEDEIDEMKELFEKYNIPENRYLFLEKIIDNKPIYSMNNGENRFNK